jgi:hypothetical protein
VTPQNAQALLREGMVANARIVEELFACGVFFAEAGTDYSRDLLKKIREFKLPDS